MTDFLNGRSIFSKRRKVTAEQKHTRTPSLSSEPSPPDDTVSVSEAYSDSSSRPTTAIRSDDYTEPHFSPSKRSHRRDSSLSSFTELRSSLRRRSTSLRAKGRDTPSLWDKLAPTGHNADKRQPSNPRPQLNISTLSSQASTDSVGYDGSISGRTPASALDTKPSTSTKTNHFHSNWNAGVPRREDPHHRPPTALGAPYTIARSGSSTQISTSTNDPRSLAKKVTDITNKRISLLKYLRLIYGTQTHWFNTYRFSSSQIAGLPSMAPPRLARRTQSLFLLGLSLPFALDPHKGSLSDYLKTLSALLVEFENYVTLHPSDGTTYHRSKIPNMFKRGVSGTSKARRGSSADGLLTSPQGAEDPRSAGSGSTGPSPASATWASFPNMVQEPNLLPEEDYQFLLTPGLPFDCDYNETFGTLCDVLCDVYRHLGAAVAAKVENAEPERDPGPSMSVLAESFGKVDSRLKKLVLVGLVKEFEEASRQGVKSEVAGVGKLVLGGLV